MRTVIITGANGFLGQHTARQFAASGWSVIGVGRSAPLDSLEGTLRSYQRCRLPDRRFGELLRAATPELCVHCAGSASVAESFAAPESDFAAGPALVFVLLNQVRLNSPSTKVLCLSSAAVYGNPQARPIAEEHDLAPVSPYGWHKLMSERLCEEFARSFQLQTASLRIFSAYGQGLRRQVVWDVCQKGMAQKEILLQGTGGESRDFLHAFDIARGIEHAARSASFHGEAYNLASGSETTIADLAERILHRLGVRARVRFDGVLPRGTPRNWRADISKIGALGFAPTVSLDDGLADVVSWCRREGTQAHREMNHGGHGGHGEIQEKCRS